jgi:hypothetical protein
MYTISEIGDIAGPVNMDSLRVVHVNGTAKLVAERSLDNISWVVDESLPTPSLSELFRLRVIEPGLTTVEFTTEL